MGQSIGLITASELLGKNFFIPSYQRGYRWDTQQVEDLLLDIDSFAKRQEAKGFYCLQPIVVKVCDEKTKTENNLLSELDNNRWFEVVDGQQRLTTLKILISYLVKMELHDKTLLEEYDKAEFQLVYETRSASSIFLGEITETVEHVDDFFISNAYKCIHTWFDKPGRKKATRDYIFKTLISSINDNNPYGTVQVIWYELDEEENPIDSFVRINMGKIPLNNAELVKALFLQSRDNGFSDFHKIMIAKEWDQMEYAFQNTDFWGFLNPDKLKMSTRIEFLFDLMCNLEKKHNPKLEEEIGKDEYSTFRYFNRKFPTGVEPSVILKEWETVKSYYSALEDWFSDPIWYHYIGFLVYCGESIEDIYSSYIGNKKDLFSDVLEKKIVKQIEDIQYDKEMLDDGEYRYNINLTYKQTGVKKFLLLFNIQYLINQYERAKENKNEEVFIRFPFQLFISEDKKIGWDVEHISSQTENRLLSRSSQEDWLTIAKNDLQILKKTTFSNILIADKENYSTYKNQFINRIDDCLKEIGRFFVNSNSRLEFPILFKMITSLVGEDSNDDEILDSIGNLTLLDSKTNQSYGNSLFIRKRRIIIELDTNGYFIPICTKNVFLKYFDVNGVSPNRWMEEDMRNHENFMGKTLDKFLTFKGKEAHE